MTALNFPASPTNGQTYENYVYDGTDGVWKRVSPGGTLGNIDDVTIDSPADGESLVYDSPTGDWIKADATVEVYGVDTAATDYFMIPVGGDAARPGTPANGHIRFNSDSGFPEWYSESGSQWILFKDSPTFNVEYLVVAGGASAAGAGWAGAGGAGGYRSSVSGESSGGGNSAESPISIGLGTYSVTIGAGGATPGGGEKGTNGSDSIFASITSLGGGGGGSDTGGDDAKSGGSGGGGALDGSGGSGTSGQGYGGGNGNRLGGLNTGGGGGAGQVGQNAGNATGGNGGNGVASSITGSSVYRAGGGGGASNGTPASGGLGGGGNGSVTGTSANNGTANTGGGGGGADYAPTGSGGSGIVIIKYPSVYTATTTVGMSSITNTIGDYKITQITAGTGTVTFS